MINENHTELNCYNSTEQNDALLQNIGFWVEGVLPIIIGVPGIVGNVFAAIILSGKTMRNSFNILLIALAIYDSGYVLLDIFQKRSELHNNFYVMIFPYLLYPLEMIAMTGSILLTVAIAIERYTAVHYPISYRQTLKNANAMKKRVASYLIPVTLICIAFNVTKFLELSYICTDLAKTNKDNNNVTIDSGKAYKEDQIDITNTNTSLDEITKVQQYDNMCDEETKTYQYTITVNEFRKNPTYAIHFNWFRFMSIGVVPFILLVYLNAQVYSDLQKRQTNKRTKKYIPEKTEQHATKANQNVQEKHKANNDLKQATLKGVRYPNQGPKWFEIIWYRVL